MLPQEMEIRRDLKQELRREFEFAHRFLTFGTKLCEGESQQMPRGIDHKVFAVSLGLYSKLCKQYRSVIGLCELGLVEDAETIGRSQFETALALHFVLRRRVDLKRNGTPAMPGSPFPRTFRATLYMAHAVFEQKRWFKEWKHTPGLKRLIRKDALDEAENLARLAEEAIGTKWAQLLQRSRAYSGVTVRQLAESLRLGKFYVSVYRIFSMSVHAGDAARFFVRDLDGMLWLKVAPSHEANELRKALDLSARQFLGSVTLLDKELDLGREAEIDKFHNELDEISQRITR